MSEQEPRNFLRRILPELKKLAKTLFPFLRTALPLFFCALAVTTLFIAVRARRMQETDRTRRSRRRDHSRSRTR